MFEEQEEDQGTTLLERCELRSLGYKHKIRQWILQWKFILKSLKYVQI